MNPHRPHDRLLALVCLSLMPVLAAAQEYPSRSISLILPYPPGGGADAAARILAPKMGDFLGRQVVVENRTGASSTIGTGEVARAAPDGYKILFADFSLAVTPSLVKSLPYDSQKQLAPVIFVGRAPLTMVVNPNLPARTVAEFVKLARDKPGALQYGSPGSGATYLAAVAFVQVAKVDMVHVAYKGAGPALSDVIAGHIPMMFAIVGSVVPQIQGRQVRALAVTGQERTPVLPDVPTFTEGGVDLSVMDFGAWFGLMAPGGTPAPVINRLNTAANQALQDPATKERFQSTGVSVLGGTPETFARFLTTQFAVWPGIVKAAGIEPQ